MRILQHFEWRMRKDCAISSHPTADLSLGPVRQICSQEKRRKEREWVVSTGLLYVQISPRNIQKCLKPTEKQPQPKKAALREASGSTAGLELTWGWWKAWESQRIPPWREWRAADQCRTGQAAEGHAGHRRWWQCQSSAGTRKGILSYLGRLWFCCN